MRGLEDPFSTRSHKRSLSWRTALVRFLWTRCSPRRSLACRVVLHILLALVLIFLVNTLCWIISLEVRTPCKMGRIGPWAVGMMQGHHPLSMHVTAPSPAVYTHIQDFPTTEPGPCLTCVNVIDVMADFVADPFIIKRQKHEKRVEVGPDYYPFPRTNSHGRADARLIPSQDRPAGFPPHYPWANTTFERLSLPTSPDHPTFQRVPMKGRWFLFFEILNHITDDGDIGVAWTEDDPREGRWTYQQVVLHEPFHLSYPFVFFHDGYYWMIPEAHQSKQIRLYRATFFPTQWEFVKPLLTSTDVDTSGEVAPGTTSPGHFKFIDTSPILYQGRWYLFTFVNPAGALYLYYSDNEDLANTKWHKHPKFPLYEGDESRNRPAGRPILYKESNSAEEVILRPVQNNVWTYGHAMRIMQVQKLSPTEFEEVEVSEVWPIKQLYWMSQRTHHLDLHYLTDEDLDEIEAAAVHNSAYRSPTGAPLDTPLKKTDRRNRWFASIDGRYSFVSQDLEYYLYTTFVAVIALLFYVAVVLPDLKLALRFICCFFRYANANSSNSSSGSPRHHHHTSSGATFLRSRCCQVLAHYCGQRRTVVGLLLAAIAVVSIIYAYPIVHASLAVPSPHLPLSYFSPPTPSPATAAATLMTMSALGETSSSPLSSSSASSSSSPSSAAGGLFPSSPSFVDCPATVVTALYDIGRGNKAHGQEKEQSWQNYLRFFHHVLHVNSCQVIFVEESTREFVMASRECEAVGRETVYVDAQARLHESRPPGGGDGVVAYERWHVRGCRYPTAIFTAPLASLRAYPHYGLMQDILDRNYTRLVRRPRRPEKTMADYNLLMFFKVEWLRLAAGVNPFASRHLFWMDGGYGKGWYFNGPAFVDRRWPDAGLVERYVNPQQLFMLKVTPGSLPRADGPGSCLGPHVLAMEHRVAIAGGFLGGSVRAIDEFYVEYHRVLNDTLLEGLMDDDQYVFLMAWCRRPDLIKLHKCYHSFLPFELWTHNSQALSFGAYHCPVGMFLDTSGSSLLDHEHISRFV